MVGSYCSVKDCWDVAGGSFSKHRFPNPSKRLEEFKKWVKICQNERLLLMTSEEIYNNCRVCGKHFSDEDLAQNSVLKRVLKALAYPHINVPVVREENIQDIPFPQPVLMRSASELITNVTSTDRDKLKRKSETLEFQSVTHKRAPVEMSTANIIQYVVVRGDLLKELKWPVGAVIAQACHAVTAVTHLFQEDEHTQIYLKDLNNMHKVVLEAPTEDSLVSLKDILEENGVKHQLWIEQPENIPTCLVSKPYPKEEVQKYFKKFKLLKS